MPFILNLETRDIQEISQYPDYGKWKSYFIKVNVMTDWHHTIHFDTKEIPVLRDYTTASIITQTRDEAWDIEYATRECEFLCMCDGPTYPITWPLQRQNAKSRQQWHEMLRADCLIH
jgi:hypothetical protein